MHPEKMDMGSTVLAQTFQLWLIGDKGDNILSPSEPIMRAIMENMILPDYVLCYVHQVMGNFGDAMSE